MIDGQAADRAVGKVNCRANPKYLKYKRVAIYETSINRRNVRLQRGIASHRYTNSITKTHDLVPYGEMIQTRLRMGVGRLGKFANRTQTPSIRIGAQPFETSSGIRRRSDERLAPR